MVFGSFAAGFIARPIGAVVFGRIGDNSSRKKALTISIYLMAIPTTLIGLLPTFESAGIWAPVMLTALRIAQGLAIGGEFTGSMIFLVEHAPENKKGFYGSIATFSAVVGVIIGSGIASLIFYICSDDQLYSFGWRIPFLISAVGGAVGSYIRKTVSEPKCYIKNRDKENRTNLTIRELIYKYKAKILHIILIDFLTAVGFFMIVIFIASYFQKHTNIGIYAQYINTFNMFVFAIFNIIGGVLCDKFGVKKVMAFPCILFILLSYPLFDIMQYSSYSLLFPLCAQCIMSMLMGLFFGSIPLAFIKIFPIHARFSGISLAHNISMAIFGGTTPLIATFLLNYTNNLNSPAFLLIGAALLSLIGVLGLNSYKAKEEVFRYC